jgi:curved DNA-binding protein CbpA
MHDAHVSDHYETLQISPNADQDTVERVYRHLAKRYHPDNRESGDVERFTAVAEAYRVLSNPEQRAGYDARHQQHARERWRVFDQDTSTDDIAADRRVREVILSVLYTARRNSADRPGMGSVELENLLGCPEEHMKFHLWYLKENGWIQRMENGMIAITAPGVDRVLDGGGPVREGLPRLNAGQAVPARPAAYTTAA